MNQNTWGSATGATVSTFGLSIYTTTLVAPGGKETGNGFVQATSQGTNGSSATQTGSNYSAEIGRGRDTPTTANSNATNWATAKGNVSSSGAGMVSSDGNITGRGGSNAAYSNVAGFGFGGTGSNVGFSGFNSWASVPNMGHVNRVPPIYVTDKP